jgi:hypothetical protein
MRKKVFLSGIIACMISLFLIAPSFGDVSGNKEIESFLKKAIKSEIKENYKGKGADVNVEVTDLRITKLDQKINHGRNEYFAEGRVTFKRTFNNNWVDINGDSFKKGRVDNLSLRFRGGFVESRDGLRVDTSNKLSLFEETPCP